MDLSLVDWCGNKVASGRRKPSVFVFVTANHLECLAVIYLGQALLVLVVILLAFACTWYSFRHERAFARTIRQRIDLSDDEFYERFYAAADIPREVPVKARTALGEVFDLPRERLRPDDDFALYDDVDLADVIYRIEWSLAFQGGEHDWTKMPDGSLNSIVHYVAARYAKRHAVADLGQSSSSNN